MSGEKSIIPFLLRKHVDVYIYICTVRQLSTIRAKAGKPSDDDPTQYHDVLSSFFFSTMKWGFKEAFNAMCMH